MKYTLTGDLMWAAHLGHKGCLKEFHLVVGQQERTTNHLSRREGRRGLETRPRVTELSEGCVLSVVAVTLFRTKRERERETINLWVNRGWLDSILLSPPKEITRITRLLLELSLSQYNLHFVLLMNICSKIVQSGSAIMGPTMETHWGYKGPFGGPTRSALVSCPSTHCGSHESGSSEMPT